MPNTHSEQLLDALQHRSLEELQAALNEPGADVNAIHSGYSTLTLTIANGWIEGLQFLLKHPDLKLKKDDEKSGDALLRYAVMVSDKDYLLTLLLSHPDIDVNEKNNDDKTALSMAIQTQSTVLVKCLLNDPKLILTSEEIYDYMLSMTQNNTILLNYFFSNPQVHHAFQNFSDEMIKDFWWWSAQDHFNARIEHQGVILFKILIRSFKQKPDFTFEEATALLPDFENFPQAREVFEHSKKMATYPDDFFFCFGFRQALQLFLENPWIEAIPALKEESENDHFVRCATTVFQDPLHRMFSNHDSIHRGSFVELFKLLVRSGKVEINQAEQGRGYHDTVLNVAIQDGNLAIVRFLLEQKTIRLTTMNDAGCRPLHIAMQCNRPDMVELLLQHPQGLETMHSGFSGNTPLCNGLAHGSIHACQVLLNHPRFDGSKEDGKKLLESAIKHDNNAEILSLLFEKVEISKEDFNAKINGWTPFFGAAKNFQNKVAEILLLDKRMDLKATDPKTGATPLHWAAETNHFKAVEFLIQTPEININVKNKWDQNTPLHLAVNSPEAFLTLFRHSDADINALNANKSTPLVRLLSTLKNAAPKVRQFFENHVDLFFSDGRIDPEFWKRGLLFHTISLDSIVIFKFIFDRLRTLQKLGDYPDPEVDPKAFAERDHDCPQITAFYAALSVLKNNRHFTCDEVFARLQAQAFPKQGTWTDKHKQLAFYYAQQTLGIISHEVFALAVFLSDDYLRLKNLNTNTAQDPNLDLEKALQAQKFFRITSRLSQELQMTLCYRVDDNPRNTILSKESEPAFKACAFRFK